MYEVAPVKTLKILTGKILSIKTWKLYGCGKEWKAFHKRFCFLEQKPANILGVKKKRIDMDDHLLSVLKGAPCLMSAAENQLTAKSASRSFAV